MSGRPLCSLEELQPPSGIGVDRRRRHGGPADTVRSRHPVDRTDRTGIRPAHVLARRRGRVCAVRRPPPLRIRHCPGRHIFSYRSDAPVLGGPLMTQLNGRPAAVVHAGATLHPLDAATGEALWTATGGRACWSVAWPVTAPASTPGGDGNAYSYNSDTGAVESSFSTNTRTTVYSRLIYGPWYGQALAPARRRGAGLDGVGGSRPRHGDRAAAPVAPRLLCLRPQDGPRRRSTAHRRLGPHPSPASTPAPEHPTGPPTLASECSTPAPKTALVVRGRLGLVAVCLHQGRVQVDDHVLDGALAHLRGGQLVTGQLATGRPGPRSGLGTGLDRKSVV